MKRGLEVTNVKQRRVGPLLAARLSLSASWPRTLLNQEWGTRSPGKAGDRWWQHCRERGGGMLSFTCPGVTSILLTSRNFKS